MAWKMQHGEDKLKVKEAGESTSNRFQFESHNKERWRE